MKLYEIPYAYRDAIERIEIDPDTGEILNADALREVEGLAADKIEAVALYLRTNLQPKLDTIKAEVERLTKRKESLQKHVDYLKAQLIEALHETGKVKTARVTVSIRKTQAVEITQEQAVPEAFTTKKVTISPNKIAIKEALVAGTVVPGCQLVERESVSIR